MGILDAIIHNNQTEALKNFNPHEIVEEILNLLKEREREILVKRYGLKGNEIKTLATIGKENGLTRERVRQIEKDVIKKLKKNQKTNLSIKKIHHLFMSTLSEYGRVMAEEAFLDKIGIKDQKEKNAIIFLISLIEDIEKYTHDNYKKCWTLVNFDKQLLHNFSNEIERILVQNNSPEKEESLISKFSETDFYKAKNEYFSQKVILNFLDLAKKIQKNVFGHWGLKASKQIAPKDVGDKAYLVLCEHKKPEHYSNITEMINKAKFDSRIAHKETVHNELIKDSRFILIGRGIYALSEWGYKPGVVADVIKEVLIEAKKPLPKDQIIQNVLQKRLVKKNTIVVGLSNKKLFKRLEKNFYTLYEPNAV